MNLLMDLYIQKDETKLKRFIPIGVTYTKYTNILKQQRGCLTIFSWWGKYSINLDIYFKLKNKYGN